MAADATIDESLGDALSNLGAITAEQRVLLESLVDATLETHDGDAQRALDTIGSGDTLAYSFSGALSITADGTLQAKSGQRHRRDHV